jgi:HEPN domain-containing protein
MNAVTLEWVEKAEGDFTSSNRELRARIAPNYDASCFHAQQAAEKYLKAFLQENNQVIPRTHILADLLALSLKIDPTFQTIQSDLNILEGYAIQFRYPGQSATRLDAKEALAAIKVIKTFIRGKLGLI